MYIRLNSYSHVTEKAVISFTDLLEQRPVEISVPIKNILWADEV